MCSAEGLIYKIGIKVFIRRRCSAASLYFIDERVQSLPQCPSWFLLSHFIERPDFHFEKFNKRERLAFRRAFSCYRNTSTALLSRPQKIRENQEHLNSTSFHKHEIDNERNSSTSTEGKALFEGRQRADCNGRDFLNSQLRLNQDRKKDKKDGTKKERRKSDSFYLSWLENRDA